MKNIYKVKGNIIITSDEEIKDCYVLTDLDKIIKVDESNEEQWHEFNCEKIILTTDEQLISDGVQSIDKPFLVWLINNPNCEEVQVYYDLIEFEFEKHSPRKKYIIIIPKEKHKRKIDTCYNFNKEIGCVQLDCRCEKEESKFEKSIENTINFMNIANAMFSKKEEPKQYTSEEEPKQGIDIQEFEKKANEIIANVGKKETIYFQPKGINPKYCERGIIHESDPNYIWYLNEPCKVLISEVKIIPKENVYYDKKSRECMIIDNLNK